MALEKRSTGIVIQFNDPKGYGFIKPDDGGEDVFVHHSTIKSDGFRTLRVGDKVEFTLSDSQDQKSRATEVTGPDGSPIASNRRDNYKAEGRRDSRIGSGGGYGSAWKTEGCYICNKSGHFARECPDNVATGGGTTGYCYSCGKSGHFAKDCPVNVAPGGGTMGDCYSCGKSGHFARDCPDNVASGGGTMGDCYSCGKSGHLARDCPSKSGCYNCGEAGHMARDCGGKGNGVGGSTTCYSCGGVGHMARDCKGMAKEGRFGGGGDKRGCFHCGEQGHFARECPNTDVSEA